MHENAAKPAIVIVEAAREVGSGPAVDELAGRYSRDYAIIVEETETAGAERLWSLARAEKPVALVIAAWDTSGEKVLAAAQAAHPLARRALLIDWGESRSRREELVETFAQGRADYFINRPTASPDERFHRAVTEFLDEWWRLRGEHFEAVQVVGSERSPRVAEVCDLLQRHDYPYGFYAAGTAPAEAVLRAVDVTDFDEMVVVPRDGRALVDPSIQAIADALGARTRPRNGVYDLAIVGGGPAGLAAAVYGSSEGLRTALIEHKAMGGQAGTSSMIRNYLGFPHGISGAELAARAFEQAVFFGTEMVYGATAVSLRVDGDTRVVALSNGLEVRARSVIVATGVAYRRLEVPELERFEGAGVFYGAGLSHAKTITGRPVVIVGGGNSAGQAAMHLAKYASRVKLVVRSGSLAHSMSAYLIREIEVAPNIDVHFDTEVVGAGGPELLERVRLRARRTGSVIDAEASAVFVLIGAEPCTGWLPPVVERDEWGYLVTGGHWLDDAAVTSDAALSSVFETSLPGVFAVGDVRQGSVKRVASAAGEGAICVRLVHEFLA